MMHGILMKGEYSTVEVAQLSGATPRQLQYMNEQGLVKVQMYGKWRVWPEIEARAAIVVSRFVAKGITTKRLKPFMPLLKQELQEQSILLGELYLCFTTIGSKDRLLCYTTQGKLTFDLDSLTTPAYVVSANTLL